MLNEVQPSRAAFPGIVQVLASDELAVGTVGKEVAGSQVQGDFGGGNFDLADGTKEGGGSFGLSSWKS